MCENAHDPLVSIELFRQVQEIKKQRDALDPKLVEGQIDLLIFLPVFYIALTAVAMGKYKSARFASRQVSYDNEWVR